MQAAVQGEEVSLFGFGFGFGKFKVAERGARKGPQSPDRRGREDCRQREPQVHSGPLAEDQPQR